MDITNTMNVYVNTTVVDKNQGGIHITEKSDDRQESIRTIIVQLIRGDHGIRLRER